MLVYRVENQLQSAEIIINNALNNPSLLKKFEGSNFDYKQFTFGKKLLDKVQMHQQRLEKEHEKYKEFSNTLDVDHKRAYKEYLMHKRISQIALKAKPELGKALKLDGAKTIEAEGWLEQAMLFYKNINYISADMEEQGIDQAELTQVRVMIEALMDAKNTKINLRKKTQEATILRDKALNQLQQWLYKFQTIAQISLQDDLQTLEALGLELES